MSADEKTGLLQAHRIQRPNRFRLTALFLCLFLFTTHSIVPLYRYLHPIPEPTSFHWKPCGEIARRPLECARLDVPWDHFREDDRTISIPLIRLRAPNATRSILLNPGGPGGSGFEFVHRRGEQLANIVGDGFHLLSFDPRGVNGSNPNISCFPSDELRKQEFLGRPTDVYNHPGDFVAHARNYAKACEDVVGELGRYINSPQTAADMNLILDAIGQDEMYYWGFSYGTTLGQTYAQMFPHKSHRVVIDGVSNQDQWYTVNALGGSDSYQDTQELYRHMLYNCFDSGRACPLSEGFSSREELYHNLTAKIDALQKDPISVYVNSSTYGVVTYEDVTHVAIFTALYKPTTWPILVEDLKDFYHGNATSLFMKYSLERISGASRELGEAGNFVQIGDAGRPSGSQVLSTARILARQREIDRISPLTGGALDAFLYNEWRYPLSHNFTPSALVETDHPLLILSTELDPVCPLRAAQAAERKYKDSVLLQQYGGGHCSVAMPSKCVKQYIRNFFYHGKLPPSGTVCDLDIPYFPDPEQDMVMDSEMSEGIRLARSSAPKWQKV
jgi:pimeloyl-ACP methyl ester carboxylesterase